MIIPKKYKADEKALEPLLDFKAEKQRLRSIFETKEEEHKESLRQKEVKKRTEEIIENEIN